MPELPEVETVASALNLSMSGHCFTRIETFIDVIRYPLELKDRPELLNSIILKVRRRGRYIIIELENLNAIIIHLGMSGSIRIVEASEPRKKHEHVLFHLDDGMTMRFDCPRRFGFIKTCRLAAPDAEPNMLQELGVEPLSDDFSAKFLKKQLENKTGKIKNAIMDNRIVVGVGNIYAAESLYMSGIRPDRAAGTLSLAECRKLVDAVKIILRKAIEAGGTTVSDYRQVDGSEGKFVRQLKVYGKDGEQCPECGKIISKSVIGGRSSFFCTKCQK